MAYEIVYKVPSEVLKRNDEQEYLTKRDLESLKEHNLLYFLRKSEYNVLYDYPSRGSFEKRLLYSRVSGPFESVSKIKKSEGYKDNSEILELLVPTTQMPIKFEEVSLTKYGTQIDKNSLGYIQSVARDKTHPEEMMKIGEKILNNLHNKLNLQEIPGEADYKKDYLASINNCLLEFSLADRYYVYPLISMRVFGKGEFPQQFLRESGIKELEKFIGDKEIGIEDSIQRGLAYNLSLNGKSISETIESENILI